METETETGEMLIERVWDASADSMLCSVVLCAVLCGAQFDQSGEGSQETRSGHPGRPRAVRCGTAGDEEGSPHRGASCHADADADAAVCWVN